jgi:TM2 domain-containing membrane protein YozV
MERSRGISRFLEGRAIAGLLAIVLTGIWIFFVITLEGHVPDVVGYSFGLVVGYYFKGEVQKPSQG